MGGTGRERGGEGREEVGRGEEGRKGERRGEMGRGGERRVPMALPVSSFGTRRLYRWLAWLEGVPSPWLPIRAGTAGAQGLSKGMKTVLAKGEMRKKREG